MPIFGGNGSVQWYVDVDNPVGIPAGEPDPRPGKPRRFVQKGQDDTPAGGGGTFTITIKVPQWNRDASWATLLADLRAAAGSSGADSFTLHLPIEDKNHGGPHYEQIRIDWA